MKAVVTDFDMVTPYGAGTEACWRGLLSGRSALAPLERFDTAAFTSRIGGTVDGLGEGESLVFQLLERLFQGKGTPVPPGAPLLLATTTGEADLIERAVLEGRNDWRAGALECLLEKTCRRLLAPCGGRVVSSACISSTAALAEAASMIRADEVDCAFVVGCDAVTEFVFAGFSSLMALDPSGSHPFDAERKGLAVGEAAGYAVLMSEERALREGRPIRGEIAGWGLGNDANHMTGPSRDGEGLARAVALALGLANVGEGQIRFISAHGTGTVYNDAMELLAFKRIFSTPRPTGSVKGGIGHSMGAAGLIEALLALKSLEEGLVPPTVGLREVDEAAAGWVSDQAVPVDGEFALTTNSGFGGVNAALVLRRPEVAA